MAVCRVPIARKDGRVPTYRASALRLASLRTNATRQPLGREIEGSDNERSVWLLAEVTALYLGYVQDMSWEAWA
jgi:hypothetical protein